MRWLVKRTLIAFNQWGLPTVIYGGGDFVRSVGVTVMCGMDTDSTAATVGSILGVMKESHSLPEALTGPLNDRVESFVVRNGDCRISDLARRTLDVVRRLGMNP